MRTTRIVLGLSMACLLLNVPVNAQTASTGALTGEVTDPNGAIVSGVRITVTNEATGEKREGWSRENGSYTVPLLLPGSYRVEFSSDIGFKLAVKTALRINVTETARLDVRLEVGTVQELVLVTSDAALLQTESSALGRVADNMVVSNLPLVTRNYTQIVTLSPGISAPVTNATDLGRGAGGLSGGNFRAHGAFGIDNNFQMNGLPINDLQASFGFSGGVAIPNPDAIQEFKVQTGQYDASYGRNAGANVNVVTKGGANTFHGTVFEFFRNDVLNANDFFRNSAGQKKGVLKQDQFGFTFGGPIVKDKLLFFGSYQATRYVNGVGFGGAVNFFSPPLTNDRSRAALGKLFAGQTGFFGGVAILADGSNISDPAFALLNLKLPNGQFVIPAPQTVNLAQPFALQGFSAFSSPAKFNEDQFIISLDYLQTAKSKFAGRFFLPDAALSVPFPPTTIGGFAAPGFPLLVSNKMRNFSVTHTYTLTSSMVNQAEFGIFRILHSTVQQEAFRFSEIGVKAPAHADPFPAISIGGSLTLGGNGLGAQVRQGHFTFQDSLTYVLGTHTLRFGGGFTRSLLDIMNFHFIGGLTFQSFPDFLLGLPGGDPPTGNGTPRSNVFASVDLPGLLDRSWILTDANGFIQDDIKLAQSFTLNIGIRYERLGNLGDKLGRNVGFDIASANPNPPAGGTVQGYVVSQNFPGTVPVGVTQVDNNFGIRGKHPNNLGPRIGFAWQLPRTASPFTYRTVLRGGYGIYYTRAAGQPFLVNGPPFALFRQLIGIQNAAASFANPFGPDLSFPQFPAYSPTTQRSISTVDQDYRPPVTKQYCLNLQTDLGHNFLVEVGYVGSNGTHQIVAHLLNQAGLASPSNPIRGVTTNTVANILTRVPILGFTAPGLNVIDSSALSRYNGLEVSVTRRLSRGLQFLAAYTFSRAFSNAATNTSAAGSGVPGNQNEFRANYGLTDFNREHRFVVSYVYQLPGPERFNPVVDILLGGWAIAGVTTIQSGLPLSFLGNNANNVYGITTDRAQLAPSCTHADLVITGAVNSKLSNYFNRSCILRNAAGAAVWPVVGNDGLATDFGNSGVGIAFGPGQNNSDIAIIKRTPVGWLREGADIEFRTEFFNAFNHPQFVNPNSNVSLPTFGVISFTSVSPRIVQFALKLNF